MFTPFTPSGSEGREGLGLGLFLAQTYAVEHGGTLQLDARDGGGTEARLDAPPVRPGRDGRSRPLISGAASRPGSAPRRPASGPSRR